MTPPENLASSPIDGRGRGRGWAERVTGCGLTLSGAEKMIMNPPVEGSVVTTSGDAMARMVDKYSSGVAGLPFWMRSTLTGSLLVPVLFWGYLTVVTSPPVNGIPFLMAVFFAWPASVVIPRFWERTEESVRSDWREQRVEKHLELELGLCELEPRVHLDPTRPIPRRW